MFLLHNTQLTLPETKRISTHFSTVFMKANDFFLTEGKSVAKIGFMIKGMMRVFVVDTNGKTSIKHFVQPNQFFSDFDGYYYGKPSGTSVQAVKRCKLLTISFSELEQLKKEIPGVEAAIRQFGELSLMNIVKAHDVWLTGSSADQYNSFKNHFPEIAHYLPLKDIAAFLRIQPSSLSRIRRNPRH